MSVSVIAKFVAIVSLCSPFLLATPAAAQRVVQRYEAYPQQRSSGNHGGGFLESLFSGGQPPPAGYSASYPQSGSGATTIRLIARLRTDRRVRSTHPFSAA